MKKLLSLILVFCLLTSVIIPFSASAEDVADGNSIIIDVTDFGADPTGANDSAIAIRDAIAYAKTLEPDGQDIVISFPTGRYDIYPDYAEERELYVSNTVGSNQAYKDKKIGILLEDIDNVTVEGNGSLFMFHGKMTTFATIDCENVSFQNFTVDFEVPTVIDITVEKLEGNNAAIVYIPECYNYEIVGTTMNFSSDASPYTGQTYWTLSSNGITNYYTQLHNIASGITTRVTGSPFSNATKIEDLGNNRFRITYSSRDSRTVPGICWQIRNQTRDHPGTFFWKSKDIALHNLDVRFLHGFGMVGQSTENITIDAVNFETQRGKGTKSSSYADYIHISGCKGIIEINDCSFANPHDDPINIHGTFLQVVAISSDRKQITVRFQHGETAGFPNYFEGDEIEFISKSTLQPVASSVRTVTKVDGPDGMGGSMGNGSGSLTDIILTLDEAVPSGVTVNNYVVENISWTPDVSIHDNIFKETPTRGVLVTTRGQVSIENNVFDGMGMAGIYISNDANSWYESGRVENVTIAGNTFMRGGTYAIFVEPIVQQSSGTPIHRGIVIADNTFFVDNYNVLNINSVDELYFMENRIYRLNPNVSVTASVQNSTMTVGGTQEINTSISGSTVSTRTYTLNGCKNVVITDNIYDGGINASAYISNMATSDISVYYDDATVGSAANLTPAADVYYYESSDPGVVTVDSAGLLTAVGTGTAKISVYAVAGDRRYDAEPFTVTVDPAGTDPLPTGIMIDSDADTMEVGGSIKFSAKVTGPAGADDSVTWSVYNYASLVDAEGAEISADGVLTASESGVLTVAAKTSNGLTARKYVSVKAENLSLADDLVAEVREGDLTIPEENKLRIRVIPNAGLWQSSHYNVQNLVLGDFGGGSNATASVKMSGKTVTNYDESGLIFYNDGDNYVQIQRKHNAGNPTINIITESNASASENNYVNDTFGDDIYLKLTKTGNNFEGFYSTDGSDWHSVGTVTNTSVGTDFKIGLSLSSGSTDSTTQFVFTDFEVDGKTVNMTKVDSEITMVNTPEIQYVKNANWLTVDITGVFSVPVTPAFIGWIVSDTEDGFYSAMPNMTSLLPVTPDLSGKWVKAVLVPIYETAVGAVYYTDAVQVPDPGESPAGAYAKTNAKLAQAQITGLTSAPFASFSPNTKFYYTTAGVDEKTVSYSFAAAADDADVEVIVNGEVKQGASGSFDMINSHNYIEVNVTAAGGRTTETYRFAITRTGDNSKNLTSLSLSGTDIPLEDGVFNYTYDLTETDGTETVGFTAGEAAKVEIALNGKLCEDGVVSVVPGSNLVTIVVTPETYSAPSRYTLNIKIPDASNSYLESVGFSSNVEINELFNKDVTSYTGTASSPDMTITAVAEEADAKITVTVNGAAQTFENGTAAAQLRRGTNRVIVKVTSPDGSASKEYTFTIDGIPSVYLSDLNWRDDSTIGWGTLHKDAEVEGNPLTLKENGVDRVFEKGIGTHAKSSLYYDIAGKGYIRFESYVGVDAIMNGKGTVRFSVIIDGTTVYTSAVLTSSSDMEFISVEIPENAQVIELYADIVENNGNDHADWADAKFITAFSEMEEYTYMIGDVTRDDAITSLDATVVLQYAAGIVQADDPRYEYNAADVSGDGAVTSLDATLILQMAAGII